jgi:hypothetical protein
MKKNLGKRGGADVPYTYDMFQNEFYFLPIGWISAT